MAYFINIKADIDRYFQIAKAETTLQKLKLVFSTYGIHATLLYRFGHWAERKPAVVRFLLLLIYYPLVFLLRNLYDIRISRHASIGKGFYIAHFGGVVVEQCRIGAFCSIHQQVKIRPNAQGFPRVSNQVWIGPHAQVVGSLIVGSGAAVGTGAILKTDIGERCLALGNPARVINKNYDNSDILVLGRKEQAKTKTVVQVKPVVTGLSQHPAKA